MVACVGKSHGLMLDVQKRVGSSEPETLSSLSVGSANQRLMLRASGCLESLTAIEVSLLQNKVAKYSQYTGCNFEILNLVFTGTDSTFELSYSE